MVADSSSSSSTVPVAGAAAKGVARTLAQHHQAVVGFLFGFFVILVLYTTVSGQFGSTNTIVVLQSTPAKQNAITSPPKPTSPASAPNNSTQEDVQKKDDLNRTKGDERIQDNVLGTDNNNRTDANLDNVQAANTTEKSGEPPAVNSDASEKKKMEEELIEQELDQDDDKNDVKKEDVRKKDDLNKTIRDERIQDNVHGTDKNNRTDANLDNVQAANTTDKSGEPAVTIDASEKKKKMEEEEELIEQELDQDDDTNDVKKNADTTPAPRKPICDLSDPRFDICDITGDARAVNRTVLYVPPPGERSAEGQVWAIRDQSRKHLEYIEKVTVKTLSSAQSLAAPECTSRNGVPAIVFAMNGLTSNPWHDFSDVLVPLFITARGFDGEVQFLVTDLQPWFVDKYRLILRNLSRHEIVDFDSITDNSVRCYPRVVVGLRSHRDLGIDPARAPRNLTLLDFRMYIRDIFSLPPDTLGIPYKSNATSKPRLMLINRGRNRKFVNLPEIAEGARAAGFEVAVVEPRRDLRLEEFARAVDACDVLMGAHGAGLTNFFFLRTGAAMLQVVPWGHMEYSSMVFYGRQAKEMMLRDVEYSITAQESTLYQKYGKDHPAVRDPESIHKQGWQQGMKYYWLEQDIRLNVTRFAPTLHHLLTTLRE